MVQQHTARVCLVLGPDRVGKTSTIDVIVAAHPTQATKRKLHKGGTSLRSVLDDAEREISTWHLPSDQTLFYDRFAYPDHYVYAPFYPADGSRALEPEDFAYWEDRIAQSGAQVCVAYIAPHTYHLYESRIRIQPDEFVPMAKREVFREVLRRYEMFLRFTSLPVLEIDSDDYPTEANADKIWQFSQGDYSLAGYKQVQKMQRLGAERGRIQP